MTRFRLGLTGFGYSGKDIAADGLVRDLGFVKVGMSTALLDDLKKMNLLIQTSPDDAELKTAEPLLDILNRISYDDAKAQYPYLRRLLQVYGTDVGRAHDDLIWVKAAARLSEPHDLVVTSGIRFINELEGIDCLIHIQRPGYGPINEHISDSGMQDVIDKAEGTIINDGTEQELQAIIVDVVQQIMRSRNV